MKPLCCSPSKVRPRNSVGKRPCGGGIGGWETPQELCPKLFWTPFFCLIGSKHVEIFCQKHVNEHVVEWNRTCFCDFLPVGKSQHGLETPHNGPASKSCARNKKEDSLFQAAQWARSSKILCRSLMCCLRSVSLPIKTRVRRFSDKTFFIF